MDRSHALILQLPFSKEGRKLSTEVSKHIIIIRMNEVSVHHIQRESMFDQPKVYMLVSYLFILAYAN